MDEISCSSELRSEDATDSPRLHQQSELVRQQLRCQGLEPFRVGRVSSVYVVPEYLSVQEEQLLLSQVASAPVTKWKNVTGRRLQNWGGVVHDKGLIAQPLPQWLQSFTSRLSADLSSAFPSPINHVLVNEYHEGQGIMPHQDGPAYFPCVAILSLGLPGTMVFSPHQRLLEGSSESGRESSEGACEAALDLMHAQHQRLLEGGREEVLGESEREGDGNDVMEREEAGKKNSSGDAVVMRESVALPPRSLLVFKDQAYTDYLHAATALTSSEAVSSESSSNNPVRVSLTCRFVPRTMKAVFKMR